MFLVPGEPYYRATAARDGPGVLCRRVSDRRTLAGKWSDGSVASIGTSRRRLAARSHRALASGRLLRSRRPTCGSNVVGSRADASAVFSPKGTPWPFSAVVSAKNDKDRTLVAAPLLLWGRREQRPNVVAGFGVGSTPDAVDEVLLLALKHVGCLPGRPRARPIARRRPGRSDLRRGHGQGAPIAATGARKAREVRRSTHLTEANADRC